MDNLVAELHKSPRTVFTNKDLALIWQESDPDRLKSKIAYYVKQGALVRLTRGVVAKSAQYNAKELATSLYAPSYISFETVLREAGVIFQHYESVFVAGPWPVTKKIRDQTFVFRTLKDSVLYHPAGVVNQDTYSIASLERAFLDMLYLFPDYAFDNLRPINWEKCLELATIYDNDQLMKRLITYRDAYAQ